MNPAQHESVIQQLTIGGVSVIKVRKGQQIVYKLANNIAVSALSPSQRQFITQEIMKLHAADNALMAAHSQTNMGRPQVNNAAIPAPTSLSMSHHASAVSAPRVPNFNRTSAHGTGHPTYTNASSLPYQDKSASKGHASPSRPTLSVFKRQPHLREYELRRQEAVRKAVYACLRTDHGRVQRPNTSDPFQGIQDALERLLPYHVYAYPEQDLEWNKERFETTYEKKAEEFSVRSAAIATKLRSFMGRDHQSSAEIELMCDKLIVAEEQAQLVELRRYYAQMTTHYPQVPSLLVPGGVRPTVVVPTALTGYSTRPHKTAQATSTTRTSPIEDDMTLDDEQESQQESDEESMSQQPSEETDLNNDSEEYESGSDEDSDEGDDE